ncbi:MAG: DUF1272 domain-containing protein [Acetobacteraceae bacterium]|nr:DUF1272 domain-containing protein [Acetobacteraceae bacterium]
MLELRPCCECCGADLPPESGAARICSFECTFCATCTDGVLLGHCPNCGGELLRRPVRPAAKLAQYPASTVRKVKPQGCVAA